MVDFISFVLGAISLSIPLGVLFRKSYTSFGFALPTLATCSFAIQFQVFQIMSAMSKQVPELDATFDRVILFCGSLIAGNFLLLAISVLVINQRRLHLEKHETVRFPQTGLLRPKEKNAHKK